MTVQVTTTAYGRPALQALRAAVARLKDAALPSRVSYYAPQLNAYRAIVEKAVGGQSATPILVFARETAARSLKLT